MATGKLPTLRRNFSWVLVGNVLYAAAQWGMLTVLAKLGTTQMVGQFALGLAISAPVILFSNLNLQAVLATDARQEYRFEEYLALRLLTTLLALAAIAVIVHAAGYERQTAAVILLIGLAKSFEAMSDVFYGLFLRRERMDRLAKSMITKGALSLTALGLAVYLTGSVVWGVVGLVLAWAAVFAGYDLRTGAGLLGRRVSDLRPVWSGGRLAALAWLSLPLGLVMALLTLNSTIPRYFVEYYLGEDRLGVFAALSYVLVAGTTVVGALGQSISPRLADHYAGGDRSGYVRVLFIATVVGALLGAGGILVALAAGEEVLTVLYSAEYARDSEVFLLLMFAGAIAYVAAFLGYGMTAARYFKIQAPLFALACCAVTLASWWLVPTAGLRGAAAAVIVGALAQLLGSIAIVGYATRKMPGKKPG